MRKAPGSETCFGQFAAEPAPAALAERERVTEKQTATYYSGTDIKVART